MKVIAILSILAVCALTALAEQKDAAVAKAELDEEMEAGERLAPGVGYDEVRKVMGEPSNQKTNKNETVWFYGFSQIKFADGHLVQWLSVDKLVPMFIGERKENARPIRVGDATNTVVEAMGTPTSLTKVDFLKQEIWYYGVSSITLVEGKVKSWEDAWNLLVDPKKETTLAAETVEQTEKKTTEAGSEDAAKKETNVIVQTRPYVWPARTYTPQTAPPPRRDVAPKTGSPDTQPGNNVTVKGYTRKDGTYVPPHTRSSRGTSRRR